MEKHKKILDYFLIGLMGVVLIYLFFKYVLKIILPFFIAFLIVSMLRPMINKICKHTKASKLFVTIFIIFLTMVGLITGVVLLSGAIIEQIGSIVESLLDNLSSESNYVTKLFEFIALLERKIPFISNITNESMYTIVTGMITDGVKSLSGRVTNWIAGVITAFPAILITIIVMFLSLFYFAKDYEKIGKKIIGLLPKKIAVRVPQIREDILSVVSKYLKSYALLMLITFAELFSGFLILGIKNSFVLALIIALVDILPVLGVGTVLIPWSIIMFIGEQRGVAIGLLIMTLVIYVVRQLAEPRIVSAQMEVHPLITLFAMYAGLKLAGIAGLIFAPLIAFIIKTSYNSFKKEKIHEKTVDNQG